MCGCFFTFLSLTACLIHEYVMLENKFLGFWEPELNWQSNKAIVNPFIKLPGGEE